MLRNDNRKRIELLRDDYVELGVRGLLAVLQPAEEIERTPFLLFFNL